jgi:NADH-quinone oxidoreductase subunit A
MPKDIDPVATLVFFLLVFGVVGVVFLFFHLLMGSVIRPNVPNAEKKTIYECGEPTVGSAWIQFDLRFYVVALLFVIFDVEVAFFFPWATVFGKANQLANPDLEPGTRQTLSAQLMPSGISKDTKQKLRLVKTNERNEVLVPEQVSLIQPAEASSWAMIAFWDIMVFFGVLLVGFAYLWRRGDIDWVRAFDLHKEPLSEPENPVEQQKIVA